MLVLSYGITKSGSTLGFEMAKAILEQKGSKQERLSDGVVQPGHGINFLTSFSPEGFEELLNEIGDDREIVVKTHAKIDDVSCAYFGKLIEMNRAKLQIVIRDPRDICLSLLDAGERARNKGSKAFSNVHTLEDAVKSLKRQEKVLFDWVSVEGGGGLLL